MTLETFFRENSRVAVAFSGGVDSSYLLYAALRCGAVAYGYYVKTAFQPQFELDDALRLAREIGADVSVLPVDVLSDATVAANPPDRCYHCKKRIFGKIAENCLVQKVLLYRLDGGQLSRLLCSKGA